MTNKAHNHVVLKPYTMCQLQFPSDLEDLIPEKRMLRVVHKAIERMDLAMLLRQYQEAEPAVAIRR
jgi:transposase